jgi:hypothetical protein
MVAREKPVSISGKYAVSAKSNNQHGARNEISAANGGSVEIMAKIEASAKSLKSHQRAAMAAK